MLTSTEPRAYSQLVEFHVDPGQQTELVSALLALDERFTCHHQGFVSASVMASDDGQRVMHQVLWQSQPDCEAVAPVADDLYRLIRHHRVSCASFGSFQVVAQRQAASTVFIPSASTPAHQPPRAVAC